MLAQGQESSAKVKAAGINKSHGSSLCLVDENGKPVFCASEERFTRQKLQRGMPHKTFALASQSYDLDTSKLAIGRLPTNKRIARELQYYVQGSRKRHFTIPLTNRLSEVAQFWFRKKILRDRQFHRLSVDTRYFTNRPLDFGFDHHLCHMASAYYCSGFDEAAVVSIDGVGDLFSAAVGKGVGPKLEMEHGYHQSEHITGQAYEIVTAMLGFDPDRHPGKVTGLAACADPPPELVDAFDNWFSDQYKAGAKDNWFHLIHQTGNESENIHRLRKLRQERFGKWEREEIAAAIQLILERDVLSLIERHIPAEERRNIALAGGVFANVKLNQRVKELGFDQIFIQPAMGDEGTGFGAALLAAHAHNPFSPYRLSDVYLGPEFSANEIRRCLEDAGLEYEQISGGEWPLEQRLAELLHQGYIIARYQGRMEFGPRSLGNRSILYHAQDPTANDWLNRQLKRSEFMPFAPVTLHDHGTDCYENLAGAEHTAEFMTMTFNVTEKMRGQSPACVHVDGTARPQLIREEINPSYYWTLKYYHELSGIPSLINTSLNIHEEPIVCTPAEAIQAYESANLDALAIGDFLVINKQRKAR